MGTFVIVHGAWGGGWAWRRTVAPHLRATGHEVFTPTLTGLGERAHLANPGVGLATHIEDIVNVLVWEDLRDVVLAGHSYGGMVITGVADRVPERLASLVYLDAFVPADGQSLADLVGPDAGAQMRARAEAEGGGWQLPPSPLGPDTPPDLRALVEPRRRPQPLQTFVEPIRLNSASASLPRTYALCTAPAGDAFARIAARLREDGAWRVVEFATGHNLHYTMARETADLLLGALPPAAGAAS
jgi:pimeloyl-ACP methyl ester carboxylesterase